MLEPNHLALWWTEALLGGPSCAACESYGACSEASRADFWLQDDEGAGIFHEKAVVDVAAVVTRFIPSKVTMKANVNT